MQQLTARLLPRDTKGALLRLLFINIILFGVVVTYDFVFWDDPFSVTQNRDLLQVWTAENTSWLFDADTTLRIMTVVWFIRKAVLLLVGLEPNAFHAINLVAHLTALSFLFLIIKHLLLKVGSAEKTALTISFLTTLLWSIDPLRAEPVAWITAQSYPIAATFAFVAIYCQLRSWNEDGASGYTWIGGMFVACVLSVLSYPAALFVPIIMALLAAFAFCQGQDPWQGSKRWISLTAIGLLIGISALVLAETYTTTAQGAGDMVSPDGVGLPFATKLLIGVRNYGYYASAIVFPYPITPARFYPTTTEFSWFEIIVAVGLFALLLGFAIKCLFRHKIQLVLLLNWLIVTVPVLGLTTHYIFPSDRYSYINHAFLWIFIAVLCANVAIDKAQWVERTQRYLYALLALFIATSAFQTFHATRIWKDNIELYGHMLSREAGYDFKALVKILAAREFITTQEPALATSVLQDLDPDQINSPDLLQRAIGLCEILDMNEKLIDLQKRLGHHFQGL